MSNMHVKSGDTVMVITGADAGKKGKVLVAMPSEGKIIVEGVAMATKHKKPRGLGQQGGGVSCDAVRTDAADHGGDSVPGQVPQRGLRSPGVEAAFPSASENVFMAVNKARNSNHAFRIDFHNFKASAEIRLQIFPDGGNRSAKDENILFPGIFRLINFGVSEDHNHCHICSCFPV